MLFELVADHASGIDAQDAGHQCHQPVQRFKDQPEPPGAAGHAEDLSEDLYHFLPQLRQLLQGRAVQRQSQQHHRKGENTHDAAAKHPHHAGDQLGKDELAFRHRQGVHQVAFAAQQIAGEAGDNGHHGHHCHRNGYDHVGEQQQRCKVVLGRAAQGKAAQHCQRNKGQIQPAVGAAGGLEFIF